MKIIYFLFPVAVLIAAMVCSCSPRENQQKEENASGDQVVEAALNQLTPDEINDGWMLLFDGKSTDLWRGYNRESFPEQGWVIEDGALRVIGSGRGEAGGGGDIITKETFSNFELSLEWNVSEGGNSGIFYLAREKAGQPIWKSAPEMQILDTEIHPDNTLGIQGNRAAGALYDLIPGKPEAVKPAGEWNHVKIMVYKGTVVHWMNGVKLLEYHLWTEEWKEMVANSKFKDYEDFMNTAEEGYIGLQDHGDDVWFRNIKIKKL